VLRELDAVSADEAVRAGALLLDVREPAEFDAGHAPGGRLLPLGDLAARADELPRDVAIVCVCRTGARSDVAARALDAAGFDAANLVGGLVAWAAEGLPVVSASGGGGVVL
jgi:rhodanese-related sulfurtransferase